MATAGEIRIYELLDSLADEIKERDTRVHERLDSLVTDAHKMETDLAVVATGCRDCRPKVIGNGTGLVTRVDRLEQSQGNRSKWFWTGVVCISTVVSGCVLAAVGAVMYAMGH